MSSICKNIVIMSAFHRSFRNRVSDKTWDHVKGRVWDWSPIIWVKAHVQQQLKQERTQHELGL